MAKCKTCGATESEADFYASIHTYCKRHWREKVKANRDAKADQYREYERSRSSLPHRVKAREEYAKSEKGIDARKRARSSYKERNAEAVAEAQKRYKQSDKGKAATRRYLDKPETKQLLKSNCATYKKEHPQKRAAHVALNNAVRDGRVIPMPCFLCGEKAEAHHTHYSDPLEVVWLCPAHHKQAHAMVKYLTKKSHDKTRTYLSQS